MRLITTLILLCTFCWKSAAIADIELSALEDLYIATNGNGNGDNPSSGWYPECAAKWMFTPTSDPCREGWYGVSCNEHNTSVKYLTLSNCQLRGYLPDSLVALTLHTFNISNNAVQGTLPTTMANMTRLQVFDTSNNFLEGMLPPGLPALRKLNLYNNSFSGNIPSSWSQMTAIEFLNISANLVTGIIPNSIEKMMDLRTLDLSNNFLNGTIPVALFDKLSVHLNYISLNNNQLTGSLAADVYRMNRLTDLDVSHNHLSGALPGVNMSSREISRGVLRHIYLSNNRFTSTIPHVFGFMDSLVILDLSNNYLGGTIPNLLFNNSNSPLKFLYLQTNRLRGVIPEDIGASYKLMHLFLFENILTGTLPASMLQLSQLQTLLLQDNELSGQPGRVFASLHSSQQRVDMMDELQILDLSNNLFTGNVPAEIFELPKIRYVSITEGCFEGSIPSSVCDATTMTHLILEGLSSGRDCATALWDPLGIFAKGFVYSGTLSGGIPSCLFQLSNLTTLHLSGNGLDGSIPSGPDPKQLKDLSLSYNRLTGTIPVNLLSSSYSKFDVSRNKITGTCDDMRQWTRGDTDTDSLLNLAFNRLSGDVPDNFHGLDYIDMLEGNIFDCPNRNSDLPRQDPNYQTYICASDDYDEMLIIWGSLSLYAVVLVWLSYLFMAATTKKNTYAFCCGWLRKQIIATVDNLLLWNARANAVRVADGPQLFSFLMFLKLLRTFAKRLALIIIVVFSIVFFILKKVGEGGTHTYQYRWITSAAYLSGTLPATMLIIGFYLVIIFAYYNVRHINVTINANVNANAPLADAAASASSDVPSRALSSCTIDSYFVQKDSKGNWKRAYAIIFCGLVVNGIVVLTINGLYVYVVSWQDLTVNAVIGVQIAKSVLDILWNNVAIRMFMKRIKSTLRIKRLVRLVLAMLLFNNILAPILSTLVTDSNCFVGMFVDNNEISTTTTLSYCAKLAKVNVSSVDFDPTTYSSECEVVGSLDLETTYIPKFQYNYQCSSSFLSNFIPIYVFTSGCVTFIVPVIQMAMAYLLTHRISPDKLPIVPPGAYFPGVSLLRNPQHHIFSTDMIMAKFLQNITVMLTFGLACPNLAFVLGVHICVMTIYYHLMLGRYLAKTRPLNADSTAATPSADNIVDDIDGDGESVRRGSSSKSDVGSDISSIRGTWASSMAQREHEGEKEKVEEESSQKKSSRKSKHIKYQEDFDDSGSDSGSDSDMDRKALHDGVNSECASSVRRPQKIIKNPRFDKILENNCRDIVLAPEVAIWTIIDVSAVCIAIILIDISGDANGLTGALLTACLPVLCIPIVLRLAHREYYLLVHLAAHPENYRSIFNKIMDRGGDDDGRVGDNDNTPGTLDRDSCTSDHTSAYSHSNRNSTNVRRSNRELSRAETEAEARYLDYM